VKPTAPTHLTYPHSQTPVTASRYAYAGLTAAETLTPVLRAHDDSPVAQPLEAKLALSRRPS